MTGVFRVIRIAGLEVWDDHCRLPQLYKAIRCERSIHQIDNDG